MCNKCNNKQVNRIQTILNTGRLHHCNACNKHYVPFIDDTLVCPICGAGRELETLINDLNDDLFDGTIEELEMTVPKLTRKG
jgi:uncharacterized Zn finger protein (UPF0148 family)